jgi:acyl dehydratase
MRADVCKSGGLSEFVLIQAEGQSGDLFRLICLQTSPTVNWSGRQKVYYSNARMIVSGRHYRLSFYDPVRLGQEIQSEVERGSIFFEPNLVVVKSVTRADMERAAEFLALSGQAASLAAE